MPFPTIADPEATLADWLLRAAELSDADPLSPAPSNATFTFEDDAPVPSSLYAEGENVPAGSLASDPESDLEHDGDGDGDGDGDDSAADSGPRAPAPIPPFPPVRELHPSLRNIIPPFPPVRELHPSLRGLRMGEAGAPAFARAMWERDFSGARRPVFSKPARDEDASGARGAGALVIEAGGGDDVTDSDSGSDGLAQYSSEREDCVEDLKGINTTPQEDASYYAPEPQSDEESQEITAKDEDEDSWAEVDESEKQKWVLKYYDSDSDNQSQGNAGDDESDVDGDDEDGTLAKRYCSDDDELPPPQKRRKLGHEPTAHAAKSQHFPIARTRGRALRRTGSTNCMAIRYILN